MERATQRHDRRGQVLLHIFYYRPQTKFAKVMFLHLSVILFTWGGCLPQCMLGYTPSRADIPLGADTPGIRHPPWGADTPTAQCMLGDMGNKRAVRILLECILVENASRGDQLNAK